MAKKEKRVMLRVDEEMFGHVIQSAEQDLRKICDQIRWLIMLGLLTREGTLDKEIIGDFRLERSVNVKRSQALQNSRM
jgi:hypothetical protein